MDMYWEIYLVGACIGLVAVPFVRALALRVNALDVPGVGRVHRLPVPRIGGLAIAGTVCAAIVLLVTVRDRGAGLLSGMGPEVGALLGGGLLVFLIGLLDDLRGVKARFKLLVQLAAAGTACACGIRLESVSVEGLFTLDLGWFSWVITIFWIVGVTNAFNFIDGTDGLSAGISALTCGLLAFIAIQTQQTVLGLLMLGLLGTLTAFLVFNFPPARIFMGDCGAMFLGFVLGAGSILCANRAGTAAGLALPALAMGIPILDTLFAVVRRLRHRRSPFAPDCRHVHHRLLNMGFTQRQVAVTGYLVTFLAILIGAFMLVTWDLDTFCVFGCGLLVLLSLFRQAEMGSANDPVAGHLYHLTMDAKRHQGSRFFQRSLLLFREARTFSDWWAAVCDAADRMGFARLSLPLTNRDGSIRKLLWRRSQGTQDEQEMIHSLTFVPDSREGPPLQIEAHVPADRSRTSARRLAALFGRFIAEHGPAHLPSKPRTA